MFDFDFGCCYNSVREAAVNITVVRTRIRASLRGARVGSQGVYSGRVYVLNRFTCAG
jgi:hypothetical protein